MSASMRAGLWRGNRERRAALEDLNSTPLNSCAGTCRFEAVSLVSTGRTAPGNSHAPLHPYKIADGRYVEEEARGWASAYGREEMTLLKSASVSA